mmetsp:Transcript_56110/g.111078  ORF Transcript_56110/g.111078 Transcript_56110/m.111078 type:complete len:232 (+) Transcript_56110:142-837(+)
MSPPSFLTREVRKDDDAAVRALFVAVWKSTDLGTVVASLKSTGGFGMCFGVAVVIDKFVQANYEDQLSQIIYLLLRLSAPVFALFPVAMILFFRSQRNQHVYIDRSLSSMRSVSAWVRKADSRKCFVCSNADTGRIMGCVMINENEIVELIVSEKSRRLGVATKLVAVSEIHCFSAVDEVTGKPMYGGVDAIVTSAQRAAIGFYGRVGYEISHRSLASIFSDQDFRMSKKR